MLPLQCAVSPQETEPAALLIPFEEIDPRNKSHINSMRDIKGIECWGCGVIAENIMKQKGI